MNWEEYNGESNLVICEDTICVRESDKALLIDFGDGQEEWIPKTQVHDDSEVYEMGGEGNLVVTRWIVEQKGWV